MAGNRIDLTIDVPRSLSDCIFAHPEDEKIPGHEYLIGVLRGEGIGEEILRATLVVLNTLAVESVPKFKIVASPSSDRPLKISDDDDEDILFCRDVISRRGAVLAGPRSGRFVYDLRRRLGLFCKLAPIRVSPELVEAGRMKSAYLADVDIVVVREQLSGIYQGRSLDHRDNGINSQRKIEHTLTYSENEVSRLLRTAAGLAKMRRGRLLVVIKEGGLPLLTDLWRDCAQEAASEEGIDCSFANIDYAAYQFLQNPSDLDVVAAPNLFGDILVDLGGVLMGSRGLTYSGNFSVEGSALYQTGHGAANDIAGRNIANPVGQIFALSMLLRESFHLYREALLIEEAIDDVWRQGYRTADLIPANDQIIVGTFEMADLIAAAIHNRSGPQRP